MTTSMRQPTIETLGLGTVIDIFKNGRLPANAGELVDKVFGPDDGNGRGSLVISGANGIVGAGKAMQLGSRLEPFGVPIVALDFPGVPDGIGKQYPGLESAFGKGGAQKIMQHVTCLHYDGSNLPPRLDLFKPRFLLEAIPEILDLKKAHYDVFRARYPGIEIRSVTSGFPSSELGVGIAHPAFPHEINKIWEIVEKEPSDITKLLWALGMIPLPVSDNWSFVLDVLFCGLTMIGANYHGASNMPYWKIDKHVRKLLGPNPFRAHDAIGAKGANFLTWSCLVHLSKHYGDLFTPPSELVEKKESGDNWYPQNHFRPAVNWTLDDAEEEDFETRILGPLFQMTSLLLHEKRAHFTHINSVGELCAQFGKGMLAKIRDHGPEESVKIVEKYHKLHPEAAASSWHPDAFEGMDSPQWAQLYVNAEHDGDTGVITLSRESYSSDVDAELNRAIDWLGKEGIERIIVTGDFHLSTQMVGADTVEFFPALEEEEKGFDIAASWSRTARRLNSEFRTSVGLINGKRCLGGMLELLLHCHYLVSIEGADLGMPEVTLPVVPGMEGCHWPFRKAAPENRGKLLNLLLTGKPVKAENAIGWLTDFAGPLDEAISTAWKIATGGEHGIKKRELEEGVMKELPDESAAGIGPAGDAATKGARKAILENVIASCGAPLGEAIEIQARRSAGFMTDALCRKGAIGQMCIKTMNV